MTPAGGSALRPFWLGERLGLAYARGHVEPVRRAVIDVGTNSIKLLVADVAHEQVQPVLEESRQTRLGQGFYKARRLQPGPIARTAEAVAAFAAKAGECRANLVRVIATSAVREAVNAPDLISAIEQASRLKVEVISGEQEADWGFKGATTNPELARERLLLVDVGGGSTQFILGQGEQRHFRQSFPLGTVRLLEEMPPSDPPRAEELSGCRRWLRDFLEKEVQPGLERALEDRGAKCEERSGRSGGQSQDPDRGPHGVLLVGTGGTASILGCMEAQLDRFDRVRLEAARLSLERVRWHSTHLWSLPLAERKQVVGLPANRADVILAGVAIYQALMERFEFGELRISTRGLRFAAVLGEVERERSQVRREP